ncbi:MAG: rRNA m(7)G-527 methyltransferase [Proteobacteria bacterium]|nr:rRNA m(7)G-527 methyltransferase [Pseudomonadota bacterium]
MDGSLRELLVTGASSMGVALDDAAIIRFSVYLRLLQQWGSKINLTSRISAEEIIVYHFLDSLAGVPIVQTYPLGRMVDLGAGAGLPSFPLKFALPGLRLLLVESVRKKVAFCQEVVRSVGAADVEALWGRADDLSSRPGHSHDYDWAVSRALGRSVNVVRMALPFLAPGGSVILYKGEPETEELRDLGVFCAGLGATWEVRPVAVPHLKGARSLVVIRLPDRSSDPCSLAT